MTFIGQNLNEEELGGYDRTILKPGTYTFMIDSLDELVSKDEMPYYKLSVNVVNGPSEGSAEFVFFHEHEKNAVKKIALRNMLHLARALTGSPNIPDFKMVEGKIFIADVTVYEGKKGKANGIQNIRPAMKAQPKTSAKPLDDNDLPF